MIGSFSEGGKKGMEKKKKNIITINLIREAQFYTLNKKEDMLTSKSQTDII